MAKKMGRPTDNPKIHKVMTRFDEKGFSILEKYCKDHQIPLAEGVRRAVMKLEDK